MPDCIGDYDDLREEDRAGAAYEEVKHLYWACLNFFLFYLDEETEGFDECLYSRVWDSLDRLYEEAVLYEDIEEEDAV
jgi:hypothetical protein